VKAVINGSLALGLGVPAIQALGQGLPLVLHSEVYDRGRPAMRGGNCPGAKIIRRLRSPERQLHVRMRVNAARDNQLPLRLNHPVSLHLKPRPDHGNDFTLNQHVRPVIIHGRHDPPVTNQRSHRVSYLTSSGKFGGQVWN
jgi:hypothetical protein